MASDGIKRLCMLLHGFSGVGKTPLSNTAPGPRLVMDVENSADWLQVPKVYWDGKSDPNLLELTPNTSVVVPILSYHQIKTDIMPWLASGRHPFKSVILDSIMESQEKMFKALSGDEKRDFDAFGTQLTWMKNLLIELKELKAHKTNPIDMVIIICGSVETKTGRISPMLDGKIKDLIAYKMDLVGYLYREVANDGTGEDVAKLRIKPTPIFEAKDRTLILGPHYGSIIESPDMMDIIRVLNTPQEVPVGTD